MSDFIDKILQDRITFSVSEGFTDIFMNECKRNGLCINELRFSSDIITGKIQTDKLYVLEKAAYKSGMIIDIKKQSGWKYYLKKFVQKIYIPLSALIATILFCFFSSIIWSIEITGCNKIDERDIIEILNSNGIEKGCFSANIDCRYLEKIITSQSETIYKTTVNTYGTKLYVDITENTSPEEIITDNTYSNIVAKKDALIKKIDVLAGCSDICAGDFVKKGDLLVSGIYELSGGTPFFTDSECIINAQTEYFIKSSTAAKLYVSTLKKANNLYGLYIFGLRIIPNARNEKFSVFENEYFPENNSIVIPFGIIRQRKTFFEAVEINLDKNSAYLIALNDFALTLYEKLSNVTIISKNINFLSGNEFTFEGNLICEEDISEKIIFEVDLIKNITE